MGLHRPRGPRQKQASRILPREDGASMAGHDRRSENSAAIRVSNSGLEHDRLGNIDVLIGKKPKQRLDFGRDFLDAFEADAGAILELTPAVVHVEEVRLHPTSPRSRGAVCRRCLVLCGASLANPLDIDAYRAPAITPAPPRLTAHSALLRYIQRTLLVTFAGPGVMANGKFVSYLRVSTAKQGASGLGLEAQRMAVTEYLNGGRWTVIQEVVEVESGKHDDRPKLAEAMGLCRLHGATLVIAKLDRLSRDAHFLLGLQKAGVRFVAADMPEANEMVVGIMAVVAQAERKMISASNQGSIGGLRKRVARSSGAIEATLPASARQAGRKAPWHVRTRLRPVRPT